MTFLFFDKVTASSQINTFEFPAVLYIIILRSFVVCTVHPMLRSSKRLLRYGNIKKLLVRT